MSGFAAVQGSRFSDQGQSDPRVDDKVQGQKTLNWAKPVELVKVVKVILVKISF